MSARSTDSGNAKASTSGTSSTVWLSRFLFLKTNLLSQCGSPEATFKFFNPRKGIYRFLMMFALVTCLASCSSVKQTAPIMAIGGNNITTNVKADIDYDGIKKVQGSASTTRVLWIFKHTPNGGKKISSNNRYRGLSTTENVALYRAKQSADVDLILEPEFETYTKSYFFGIYKKTEVKVKGWGANIKGFKEGPVPNNVVKFGSDGIF